MLIGDVLVGAGCYIGPAACLRGDFGRIQLRGGANVQDCCVMHGFPGTDTVVEEEGHIGHGAILHGCMVQKNALIGMNAVVNDNAVIGESAIVAAMAFVKAGMVVPPRTLAAGVPAKVVRTLTDQELAWKIEGTQSYQELARRSLATHGRDGGLGCCRAEPQTHRAARAPAAVDDQGQASIWRLTLASAVVESDSITALTCTTFSIPKSRFGPR